MLVGQVVAGVPEELLRFLRTKVLRKIWKPRVSLNVSFQLIANLGNEGCSKGSQVRPKNNRYGLMKTPNAVGWSKPEIVLTERVAVSITETVLSFTFAT
jgi:hypothetical protein